MDNKKMPLTKDQLLPFLCNISEQYHMGIAIIHLEKEDFPLVYINTAFTELTGFHHDDIIGKNIRSLRGIKTNSEVEDELFYHFSTKTSFEQNILHYHKDGIAFWNNITFQTIKDSDGHTTYAMLHCKDITESMLNKMLSKLEHEVYIELEENGDLQDILQLITEKVEKYYIRDINCTIHILQPEGKLVPIASGSLPLSFVKSIDNLETSCSSGYKSAVYINNLSCRNNEVNDQIKKFNISSCWSKPIFINEKKLLGYFSIYIKNNLDLRHSDIEFLNKLAPIIALSMKYVEQKQALKRLAFYDVNTGMPNYNYFYSNLVNWVEEKFEGSILIIQPNEYSSIVDLYGRKFGDELIGQIFNRLMTRKEFEQEMIYGRFSNSTFILAVKKLNHDLEEVISQMLQSISEPFTIANRELFITLKIGVSHLEYSISIDESIRRADTALTNARLQNVVVSYFEPETEELIQRELDIVNQLRYGLQNEEFSVHLQPKVNLKTAEIEGFEALARWFSPMLGHVSPVEFIRIAERSGKIHELDNIILRKVLHFQSQRLSLGLKTVPIAVNISPVHFYNDSFVEDFVSLVNEFKIQPELIKIEVTESLELFDFNKAKNILIELKKYGYESSIDDFGVGFSSLSYLQQLPFSEIKIDRSFINGINNDDMHSVVQTIVQLASNLRMHVVAEGIETSEQFALLQKMGCRTGQGYFFHKPMPIEHAEKLLN